MGGAAWGQVEPIRSDPSWNKNIKQFYVKQKIGRKKMKYKNRQEKWTEQ
jgi:predicted dinucleotide-utilizing enzyme